MSEKMMDVDAMIDRIRGLYIGQLDDAEKDAFEELQREGFVAVRYDGPSGALGMGKVHVIRREEFYKDPGSEQFATKADMDKTYELINDLSRRVDRLQTIVDKLHRGEKVEIGSDVMKWREHKNYSKAITRFGDYYADDKGWEFFPEGGGTKEQRLADNISEAKATAHAHYIRFFGPTPNPHPPDAPVHEPQERTSENAFRS